jgi:hypothetical protein
MSFTLDVAGVVKVGGKDSLCLVGQGSVLTKCLDLTQTPPKTWSNRAQRGCLGNHHCTVNVSGVHIIHLTLCFLELCFPLFPCDLQPTCIVSRCRVHSCCSCEKSHLQPDAVATLTLQIAV